MQVHSRLPAPAALARPRASPGQPRAQHGRRLAPLRAAGGEGGPAASSSDGASERRRSVVPPPQPAPIEHSSTYMLRSRRGLEEEQASTSQKREPFTGNAVQWYLKRLDKKVSDDDAMKPAAMAYYRATQTPAGSSAVRNVGSVVGQAAKLGGGALRAAAPVGKWALLQGLSAAGKALAPSDRKEPKELPPPQQQQPPPKDDSAAGR